MTKSMYNFPACKELKKDHTRFAIFSSGEKLVLSENNNTTELCSIQL